ncbi:MAG: dihydroorotase, partial [Verrucomicrobia bacterium]|nr:dihydroorotase [Verrucomicrobiota bacterium]
PLLLNAASHGHITLPQIIRLMRTRVQEIFRLPPNDDWVLLDLNQTQTIDEKRLKTKCGWSPYAGLSLKGWPVKTILKGKIYDLA